MKAKCGLETILKAVVSFFSIVMMSTGMLNASTYAQISSLNTQALGDAKTAIVKMENMEVSNGIDLASSKDKVMIKEDGVYFIMAAPQVGSTNSSATGYVDVWLMRNGNQMPNSNVRKGIAQGSDTTVVVSQTIAKLNAGDSIGIGYSASNPALGLIFTKPENEPAIPSLIFSIFKIGH